MKVLSLRQPWANAVLYLGKTIENRRWPTRYRGELLLHAAKGMTEDEMQGAADFCEDVLGMPECYRIAAAFGRGDRPTHRLERGGLVGRARLVGCVVPRPEVVPAGVETHYPAALREHAWRWHMREQYGFVLEDVRPMPFLPCRGTLGLFDPTPEMRAHAEAHP